MSIPTTPTLYHGHPIPAIPGLVARSPLAQGPRAQDHLAWLEFVPPVTVICVPLPLSPPPERVNRVKFAPQFVLHSVYRLALAAFEDNAK